MAKGNVDVKAINIPHMTSGDISIGNNNVGFSQVVAYKLPQQDEPDTELESAAKKLSEQIDQYFALVAETLSDNRALQEQSLKRLQSAKEIYLKNDGDDLAWTLNRAQFEVRSVHAIIVNEQKLQRDESRFQWIVPVLVLVYVAAIIALIVFAGSAWDEKTLIPIIGVPASVILWAAIGSIAAMLYRFYTHEHTRTSDEIRWLIARPLIGILMGALSYIAIISGLFIFGNAVEGNANPATPRYALLWALAFLAGFSDRFFETIINLIEGKVSPRASDTESSKIVTITTEQSGVTTPAVPNTGN